MGIKSINEFLKKEVPEAFYVLPLSEFGGYRIAIDSFNYLYCIMCASNKSVIYGMSDPTNEIPRDQIIDKTKRLLMFFISKLILYNITPVFVWDGEQLDEKIECKAKRSEDKENRKKKIENVRNDLDKIHPLYRTADDFNKLRSVLAQHNEILPGEMNYFRTLIESLGIPSLQAEHEGEKLCSALAREKWVYGVLSTDTDNYALGTPLLLTSMEGYDNVNVVDLGKILSGLKKNQEWFVEFCIMCGCDFNNNIKGIGPAKAYKLLTTYNNIDEISEIGGKDVSILNHNSVRELFKYTPSNLNEETLNFKYDIFIENIDRLCNEYNLSEFYTKLSENVKNLREPQKKKKKLNLIIIK